MDTRCSSEGLTPVGAAPGMSVSSPAADAGIAEGTGRKHGGYSFSAAAGPLPPEVVEEVTQACRAWRGGGSVLGLSFTSPAYRELQDETEACLRRLLGIPDHFRVLFMHGGASAQFALVPLNLLAGGTCAAYVETGHWSRRALQEARRYGKVTIAARDSDRVPDPAGWRIDPRAAYCHVTSNETADGLQYHALPEVPVPLVADMSSDFLTRPLDFGRLALAYAATQKVIGVPGLTLVIVRDDLLGRASPATPRVMDYGAQAVAGSRLNTPPVLPVFLAHRMLRWIEGRGGVAAMEQALAARSGAVAAALEAGGHCYRTRIAEGHRSRVNPCFGFSDARLAERFIAEAEGAGLFDLRGHPAVGGVRVSLYNGIGDEAVHALVAFLRAFAAKHG